MRAWGALEARGNSRDGFGFIVFWPIGLAVLGWKFWQRNSGYPGDIVSFGREKWGNRANWASSRWGFAANNWQGFASGATGNRAFDEWRATELARLEEEANGSPPPSANSRTTWKISATPRIARNSSAS
jgi:Protein of unknown function (DUF2852)